MSNALDPLAVALQGIGFGADRMALQGFLPRQKPPVEEEPDAVWWSVAASRRKKRQQEEDDMLMAFLL
jgi:hypothetical protein